MIKFTVKVTGDKALVQALQIAENRWKTAVATGMYQAGLSIMAASKRIVPVDTGTLRESGFVTLPSAEGNSLVEEIGYGGPSHPYAVVMHEVLWYKHKEGKKAKFLESVINARGNNLVNEIGVLATEAFKRRTKPTSSREIATTPNNPEALARNAIRLSRRGGGN